MLHEEPTKKREQISLVCINELVPQNHLLRKIDRVIDWSFLPNSFTENSNFTLLFNYAFTSKFRQHFQHMFSNLLRIVIKSSTDQA